MRFENYFVAALVGAAFIVSAVLTVVGVAVVKAVLQ
jgi:hypothetical protein